jgi:uncharacterized lipoprotein YajG
MRNSVELSRKTTAALLALHAAAICLLLAGCNVGPKYISPTMTAPSAYKESPEQFKEANG